MIPQAVLFDLDGTLVDTHHLIWRCLDETLANHFNVGPSTEIWKNSVGLPLELLFSKAGVQHGFEIADMATLVLEYRERLYSYEREVSLFGGIAEMIEGLASQSIRLAIVTTKYGGAAKRHLNTTGVTRHFEVMISGDMCENLKPHPEPFLKALAMLGLPAEAAVAVGDSVGDIVGARAAGVMPVGAMWGCEDIEQMRNANPARLLQTPKEMIWW